MSLVKILFFILISSSLFAGHTEKGTNYGQKGVSIYSQTKHGPDGALFLDPYFMPYLNSIKGKVVLDAGCGAGPWSVAAAKNGAAVYGIDIQEEMIKKAKVAIKEAGVQKSVQLKVGDVAKLPYEANFFDQALSINVGCNLPQLGPHISELARVLKKGGIAVITAPASFDTVFTDGSVLPGQIASKISQILLKQRKFPDSLLGLDEVYRATFALKKKRWTLVTDESQLKAGEKIWRKIPKLMVPNNYHHEKEYLALLKQHGFTIQALHHPQFANNEEREKYNSKNEGKLGTEYFRASPFVIIIAEKAKG